MRKVATSIFKSKGWLARTQRGAAILVAALLASACSTWLDREVVDRDLLQEWTGAAASMRTAAGFELVHVASASGLYRLSGGTLRHAGPQLQRTAPVGQWWTGYIGATGPDTIAAAADQFVLAAGDEVRFRWAGAESPVVPLRLEVRSNLSIEIEDVADGDPWLVFEEQNGSWTLAVTRSATARPSRRVQRVERSPSTYESGNLTFTAEELDSAESLQWIVFPPLAVGRLISRALGARLEAPKEINERVVDEYSVKADYAVPCRVPVAGASYRWKLILPKFDGGTVVDVTTPTTGRAAIDFRNYLALIDERIDLGQTGSLQVTDKATNKMVEQAVDLLRIRDATRAQATGMESAQGLKGDARQMGR